MPIILKNKDGVLLKTAGKYCPEDITVVPQLQEKTVTPSETQQTATPDANYAGLSKVIVEAIPADYVRPSGTIQITENGVVDVSGKATANVNVPSKEEETKTVDLNMASGNQTITPTSGKVLSQVVVKKPATMLPENIKKDVNIGGVTGTLESGGGGELNIAYGDTAPEDTSKLWIKSEKPSNISFPVVWKPEQIVDGITDTGIKTLSNWGIGSAAVGTKIYLFSGIGDSYSSRRVQVFDTKTETLETLSVETYANRDICAVAVDTKIYLFGGFSGSFVDSVRVFDTTTNTIQKLTATIKIYTDIISAAAVGTKIYLFGVDGTQYGGNPIYIFDTETNTVQSLSNILPDYNYGYGVAAVGTKIYLFGGRDSNSVFNNIYIFDTTTNTVQSLSNILPKNLWGIGAAAVGTKIYLFGGRTGTSGGDVNNIYIFDTETNTVQSLSNTLPKTVYYICAAAVGTKIYLFGGEGTYINPINLFTVYRSLSSNDIIVTQEYYSRTFKVLKAPTEVEVSVKYVYKGDSSNHATFIDAYLYDGANWVNVNTGATA